MSSPSALTAEAASKFAGLALGHVAREYPNKLDHVMAGLEDAVGVRDASCTGAGGPGAIGRCPPFPSPGARDGGGPSIPCSSLASVPGPLGGPPRGPLSAG